MANVPSNRQQPLTLEQAKVLDVGDYVSRVAYGKSDATPQLWRVVGKAKIRGTSPALVRVPIMRGDNEYGYVTEQSLRHFQPCDI